VKKILRSAIGITICTLVLTGIMYPLFITGIAQVLFPYRAGGSLITGGEGNIVGSELIAQDFRDPAYFHPRPSAAGGKGYNGAASSGSNLGPTSKKLRDRVTKEIERLKKENPAAEGPIPVELVTTSGSGLDPHLSPSGAFWQIPRIAGARDVEPDRIRKIVEMNIEGREFGFLGNPRANVLTLNRALDRYFGPPPSIK
jgi:K+-transporting ATPase ATPase C chain